MNYFLFFWFLIMGVVVLLLALLNTPWFFDNPSVRLVSGRLGRNVTRGLYITLGLLLLFSACLFFWREIYPTI
jgi:hypothetical protein